MSKLKLYSKEYTIGATGIVNKNSDDLMSECPRLNLPVKAVYFTGDAAFEVWLNGDEQQKLEVYATPYRTPLIPVDLLGFKIVGTNTKVVTAHMLYNEMKGVITQKPTDKGEFKKT